MAEPCTQGPRIENLQDDIRELKEITKQHSRDIAELKNHQAETRIYVKQILERLEEQKAVFDILLSAPDRIETLNSAFSSLERKILSIEERSKERESVGKSIREWGGWILAVLMGFLSIYNLLR